MDFFQAQEDARRRTKWLRLGFYLSVLAVMILIGLLVTGLFCGQQVAEEDFVLVFFGAAFFSGLTILVPYGVKSVQLSQGGEVVAKDLGGRLLDSTPSGLHEQRLMNIVEEMALASGVPVPQVYVMDKENGINAFAAGTEPTNAVIGVTRGCLERLTREELQGVIAHEFSHILNGDMKMNMKMIGWVCGLMGISIIGQMLFRSMQYSRMTYTRSRDREENGNQAAIVILALGLGFMLIGGLGVFFGRLLQSAISRQREYLADASAVQFTRNPETIAGALKKIGGLREGSRLIAPKAAEASHMLFSDGGLFSFGFATHPPLRDRIKRVQGGWDESFADSSLPPLTSNNQTSNQSASQLAEDSFLFTPSEPIQHPKILQQVPHEFVSAARHPDEAQLLIFALLISSEGGLRGAEAQTLNSLSLSTENTQLISQWSESMQTLHSARKILLIDLIIPSLRRLSQPVKERFIDITRALIESDRNVSLFEYMLQRVIERHLIRHARGASYSKVRYHKLNQVLPHVQKLSQIMEQCQEDTTLSREAMQELDQSLNVCERSSPELKQRIIEHMTSVAVTDGSLSDRESELLRAIAVAFGCICPLEKLTS